MPPYRRMKHHPSPAHSRLGSLLKSAGLLTSEQLRVATEIQRSADEPKPLLSSVLTERGFVSEDAIAHALAEQLGVRFVDVSDAEIDYEAVRRVPLRLARRHTLVPLSATKERMVVAMADPTNLTAIDDVKAVTGIGRIEIRAAGAGAIETAIDRFYSADSAALQALGNLDESDVEVVAEYLDLEDEGTLERSSQTAPIIRLVSAIIASSLKARATDVHIEPRSDSVSVRYRVDGLLTEVMTLPKHVQLLVGSRIKIISGMDISERRRPQDGRRKFRVEGHEVDTRVSTMPTMWGEKIVIRLLHKAEDENSLTALGLEPEQHDLLSSYLLAPQGLVIFTGPTGAGKTSTMYAGLSHVQDPSRNLVTLEDPVEFEIDEVNQVQVDHRAGITFARGLRSLLRQDPDVIMVGEIRDLETAQMVLQAASTGHLVMSSLHTRDAPSALTRLRDLGLEPFRIASSVSLVVAQRLVRVICDSCSVPENVEPERLLKLGLDPADFGEANFFRGQGCEACNHTGYLGRTGIFEMLPVSRSLREGLIAGADDHEARKMARSEGMTTMLENGLHKVLAGITSLEEVDRVLHVDAGAISRCTECDRDFDDSASGCPHCFEEPSGKGALPEVLNLRIVEQRA